MSVISPHAHEFYIDGAWVAPLSSQPRDLIDPATEKVVAQVAFGSEADVERAVQAAHRAFPGYAQTSLAERKALLQRIVAVYTRRMDDVAAAITAEMGAPLHTLSKKAQAPSGLGHFAVAAKLMDRYAFEQSLGTTRILKEPVGVCALIAPWNWPMNQVACKIAPALATGCTMVLKPSQYAPLSSLLLAEILHEAGVPPGVFNLVNGEGASLGESLASHPLVDMVSLTGSTSAGAAITRAAAGSIKRVSLELGGKSANVILPDADLGKAVTHGVRSLMSNSGQSCNAPSRMLVPRAQLAEAEAIASAVCAKLVVGDPQQAETHMGPMANPRQWQRVQQLIARGVDEGARLVCGGTGKPQGLDVGWYARPTVFSDVRNDMLIAQEEIFGPVLVMIPYDSEEEAIRIANDSIYGLSGYVYGATPERAAQVARRLRTGMVHLNGAPTDVAAPFGGYRQSGNGREWGAWGFDEFCEVKAVMGYPQTA